MRIVTQSGALVVSAVCVALVASVAIAQSNPFASNQHGYPNWSPFTGVKWEKDRPIVQVNEKWYDLVSIHGVTTDAILKKCEKEGWDTRKRVAEDLVQILRLMGHKVEKTTDLVLRDKDGKTVAMKNVTMTVEKRRKLMRGSRTKGRSSRPAKSSYSAATLSRADVLKDLETFQKSLESQFAYLKTNGVDYRTAIQAIAARTREKNSRAWLAAELQKVMAQFIDGHAGVSGATSHFTDGYLPFLIAPSGERFVAVRSGRSGFLHEGHPYIKSIDGVELDRWLQATEKHIAQGSRQYRLRHGLRLLRSIQQLRGELGLEQAAKVDVALVSRDGRSERTLSLDVAASRPAYGTFPPVRKPAILDGNIGYLRLKSMNDVAVALLEEWMPRFRETDGLIIDVRGNGGGIRTPILELAGYLLSKDDAPRIGNVAKYRLAEHFDTDHLSAARFVYRENSPRFGDRQRAAIREFKKSFKPEWNPPSSEFSDWHYLVLSKDANDGRFDYRRPVAILMDEGCFSATDIFLSTFKGWPRVTLIGQPSSGGSARSQSFRLPRSGISVRCASMASFQPNGRLYDTHGVEPDIRVSRPAEYYIHHGEDVVLDKASSVLLQRRTN